MAAGNEMSFDAVVYNVMIASPSDVANERDIVRDVIAEWNAIHAAGRRVVLLPLGWETHSSPAMGTSPQEIINQQILGSADLLVGVFWTRIGTATSSYASGTVEEIEEHIKAKKPVMLYFSGAPVHPDSVDPKQYGQLKEFRESLRPRGLFETFNSPDELRKKFNRQLQLKLNQDAYFVVQQATVAAVIGGALPDRFSREALILLKNVSQDRHGTIQRLTNLGGTSISSNGQTFVEYGDFRGLATWEAALRELEEAMLLEATDYGREMFRATRRGYEMADRITL